MFVQDMKVIYYHAYIDGVDFVFIDNPIFHHVENEIYGGDRTVSNAFFWLLPLRCMFADIKS